jgi:hypothetical protein
MPSAKVVVVGVRHHSPACARLVAHTIEKLKPRYVLVEGPSDMNERIDELLLGHQMPIALFSYRQNVDGTSRGTWTPFCEFSPELVAMQKAKEVGAKALWMDLPAWDDTFIGVENRFGSERMKHSDKLGEIADTLGFEDTDALWDHLFEQPLPMEELEKGLGRYFEVLRGDEPGGPRDEPREAVMTRFIAAAVKACGDDEVVVVVCGGYHKPAIERQWADSDPTWPDVPPVPQGTRVGSYFVPYSLRRLDSFAGYASGMPSPGFYQAVWEQGMDTAAESMLFHAIQHLRKKQQRVSPADAIAASTLAHGLRTMRGHRVLTRIDVLDGLAGALVKEALDAPLPWTRRGTLARHTDALLVELVAAFSGDKYGVLAKGTPAPPLLDDTFAELTRVGVEPKRGAQKVTAKLTEADGSERSRVLHRVRVLGIPGFTRTRAPSLLRTKTDLSEDWSVERLLETDPALIEAAVYGGSLLSAAAAKLEERCREGTDVAALADALFDAALCGIRTLTDRWLTEIASRVAQEPSLAALGKAMHRLLPLWHGDLLFDMRGSAELGHVLSACFDRALWLYEGIQGAKAELDEGHVYAVHAVRELIRHGPPEIAAMHARAHAVCERRVADMDAPPALRGAALGLLWSTRPDESGADEQRAITALRASSHATTVGDFLAGLFILAREEVIHSEQLLGAIDFAMTTMIRDDFMIALPAVRQAFSYFPPRERLTIAEGVLARMETETGKRIDPHELLHAPMDIAQVQRGARVDKAAHDLAKRYGLLDDKEDG